MSKLKGKVAVVTGSTSGIGRSCAALFAKEGARVVITGRRHDVGQDVAASIGDGAIFVDCDVTHEADIKCLIDTSLLRFGQIDCLVNNAGAASNTRSIIATDPEAFDYEVAKAALVHLTRCAALEFGEKGVRVNAISPGPTLTGIFGKHSGVDANAADRSFNGIEAGFTAMLSTIQSMPGMVHAQDIANAALFLASDQSHYVNGHDLIVDGGISAGRPASTMQAGWKALGELVQSTH